MKNLKSFRISCSLAILTPALLISIGCGKDGDASAGDKAKSATDAVVNKATDIKDAIVGTEVRAKTEADLRQQNADLKAKVAALEEKQSKETVPTIKAANQKRLDNLKAAVAATNAKLDELAKSSDTEWNAKKDAALASLDDTKAKVNSVADRQKLIDEVNQKLTKLQNKIEALKAEAQTATAENKQKLDADRSKLEAKYTALKADSVRFQESAEDKWDNFKERFSKSFEDLSSAYKGLFD